MTSNNYIVLLNTWYWTLGIGRADYFSRHTTTQSQLLTALKKKSFENIVGIGENAGNKHFLLFLQSFIPIPKLISVFKFNSFFHQQVLLDESKTLSFDKELRVREILTHYQTIIFRLF